MKPQVLMAAALLGMGAVAVAEEVVPAPVNVITPAEHPHPHHHHPMHAKHHHHHKKHNKIHDGEPHHHHHKHHHKHHEAPEELKRQFQAVQNACSDEYTLLCGQDGVMSLLFGGMVDHTAIKPPLGFGSPAADDCMRSMIDLLSSPCKEAIEAVKVPEGFVPPPPPPHVPGFLPGRPPMGPIPSPADDSWNVISMVPPPAIFGGMEENGRNVAAASSPFSPAITFVGDSDDDVVPSNDTTPATDDDDYEAFGGRQVVMACLALFGWGLMAFLFIRSFMRAEAHREKLIKFWRTVTTNPELKAAVERAAGGQDTIPEPPKSDGCLKFCRIILVGLFLVISLQLFLGLALAPPMEVVVENDDVSDEYYPQGPAALLFFLVVLLVILVTFLAFKGIKACLASRRRRTSSPSGSINTPSATIAPPAYASVVGNLTYRPQGYVPLPSGDSEVPEQNQQVYVGVPVSAPPAVVTGNNLSYPSNTAQLV